MNKVNDFDPEKYKELLEKLGNCRRGIEITRYYEGLLSIEPGGYISGDLENLLNKWSSPNPSASWGSCHEIARKIHELLLGGR